jgi:hypothetical protein
MSHRDAVGNMETLYTEMRDHRSMRWSLDIHSTAQFVGFKQPVETAEKTTNGRGSLVRNLSCQLSGGFSLSFSTGVSDFPI